MLQFKDWKLKATPDKKPQAFKIIIDFKLQFFKDLAIWCTNSTLLRSPNINSFPKFNLELLGLQGVICMLKTLYLKEIRNNMTKTTLKGIEKVSFLTAQHKKKKKKKQDCMVSYGSIHV